LKAHSVSFTFHPANHRITLQFGDGSPLYTIKGFGQQSCITNVTRNQNRLSLRFQSLYGNEIKAEIVITDWQTICFSIKGDDRLTSDFPFPGRVGSRKGESWVIPSNEGLLIPLDDPSFTIWRYDFYSGHSGLCMPFLGFTGSLNFPRVLT
jgi:hypothetical protein